MTEIRNAFDEAKIKFITGELNLDRDWDRYVEDLNRRGLQEWLKASQVAYDRFMSAGGGLSVPPFVPYQQLDLFLQQSNKN